jgi:hypothetical protein
MVYNKSFDALPAGIKTYVYRRLNEILSGTDKSKDFSHLSVADRTAILRSCGQQKRIFRANPEIPRLYHEVGDLRIPYFFPCV